MPRTIYEINTQVWLREQLWAKREGADLADVPREQIKEWAKMGIDAVWLLGVWTKGAATREICRSSPDLRARFSKIVPDLRDRDIIGSPFSIADYSLDPALGDETTLPRLRGKLRAHGIRLILDFVPNHLAVDHPWVQSHPERFVGGSDRDLEREPENYFRTPGQPDRVLAHGRDPYFAGWTDTAQINVFNRGARRAMIDALLAVSDRCDGARCDMAMLALNGVFKRTWGDLSLLEYPEDGPPEFWAEAIAAVRERHPDFLFMAEVYWGLESQLQNLGFDLTYDKALYDRILSGEGEGIREHLVSTRELWGRMVRFIENHDEARAARAFGPRHAAAALLISGLPGAVLYHEGQFEGRRAQVPVQLATRPKEPVDNDIGRFYSRLLRACAEPVMHDGEFRALEVSPAWEDNPSHRAIVAYARSLGAERRVVAVNIANHQAQAYIEFPLEGLERPVIELRDVLGDAHYYRSREKLAEKGLYLDMAPGTYHLFRVRPAPEGATPEGVGT
ncbi:MAG TPA: alpha-amylase family glycosyl hydrolase [Sumerlaeia bacterium]|nr:alpha-amylase family glycosyl hydrolase [Sumerlaeia bacterium]